MSESKPNSSNSSSKQEKLWRFGRDFNAVGAVAIAGVALFIPGPNVILASWAGLNAAQAGGFELLRQNSKSKKNKKRQH